MVSGTENIRIPMQKRKDSIFIFRFEVVSVVLLYLLAAISIFLGVLFSSEWANRAVSTAFLLATVIIPIVSIAIAFGIQVIALIREGNERGERYRLEAKFLAAIDRCHGGSIVSRNFLGHLLDQWDVQMKGLSEGVVTIQKEYWLVCAQFYGLAKSKVECTSCIPLSYWQESGGNKELLRYKQLQIDNLIKHNICVRRTFIMNSITESNAKMFLEVANTQLHEGFCIYYIELSKIPPSQNTRLLARDFALIDSLVLMLGRQSGINQNVYYYDFFELGSSAMYPTKHAPALNLFSNRSDFLAGSAPELLIEKYRVPIHQLPILKEPKYKIYSDAILPQVRALKCW